LARVVDNFAALSGFVLHAPLADFSAERETGKLTAAANAICHILIKEYQQFAGEDKGAGIGVGAVSRG
jgi:hypothetical protein